MWLLRELSDRAEIQPYLEADRWYAAYAIGDLDPWFFPRCRWWLATKATDEWALALSYVGLEPPALFCAGKPDGVAAILDGADLPDCQYFSARPDAWPEVERRSVLQFAHPMFRMVLDGARVRAAGDLDLIRLRSQHLEELAELFALGAPGDADGFGPDQVEQGVFYGRRAEGRLVSVAGTHLVSSSYRLAALGNVFTHPQHRGQGHATACAAAVTAELARRGLDVVLNVAQANHVAVHVYEKLGFCIYCPFVEGIGARGTSADSHLRIS